VWWLNYRSKSARPAPSSHNGHLVLIEWVGMRLPRMHRWVARRTMTMLRRVRTYDVTCDSGLCHLVASFCESFDKAGQITSLVRLVSK
jgi:hypothetical protein